MLACSLHATNMTGWYLQKCRIPEFGMEFEQWLLVVYINLVLWKSMMGLKKLGKKEYNEMYHLWDCLLVWLQVYAIAFTATLRLSSTHSDTWFVVVCFVFNSPSISSGSVWISFSSFVPFYDGGFSNKSISWLPWMLCYDSKPSPQNH